MRLHGSGNVALFRSLAEVRVQHPPPPPPPPPPSIPLALSH